MQLRDRKMLVTGASSGIGQAIATTLASKGAHVAFTYNTNEEGAEETLRALGEYGLKFKVDMYNEGQIKAMFKELQKEWVTLDVLVNNAGINRPRGLFEPDDWREIFQVDLFSVVLCTGLAVELMNGSGKILNITSIYGFAQACDQGIAPYGAAKSALNHYTQLLAKNLAPNIQVNAIAPGYVKTPLWGDRTEKEFEENGKDQLIERMIEPTEIAEMAQAILTNDAMTGEIVIVDGGLSLKTV